MWQLLKLHFIIKWVIIYIVFWIIEEIVLRLIIFTVIDWIRGKSGYPQDQEPDAAQVEPT